MAAISTYTGTPDYEGPAFHPEAYLDERDIPFDLQRTLHPKALAMYRKCRDRLHRLCEAMTDTSDTREIFYRCMTQLAQETREYNRALSPLARGGAGDKPAKPSRFAEKFSIIVTEGYTEYKGTFSTDEKIARFIQRKIDEPKSYPEALIGGATDAVVGLARALRHPHDEVVKPVADFAADAAEIAFNPHNAGEARERMGLRKLALSELVDTIKYGSGPERVKIATTLGVSIWGCTRIISGLKVGAAGIKTLKTARQLPVSEGMPVAACKSSHDARHLAETPVRSRPYIGSCPVTVEKAQARMAAHQKAIFSEAHELKAFVPKMRVLPISNTTEFYRACDSLYVSSSKLGPTGRGFAKMNLPFLERGDSLIALVHRGRTPFHLRTRDILTPFNRPGTTLLGKSAGISHTEWVKEALQALTKKAGPKSLYVMWDPKATPLASTLKEMGGALSSRSAIASDLGHKKLVIAKISMRIPKA